MSLNNEPATEAESAANSAANTAANSAANWSGARRALRPEDQSLLGPTRRWLRRLPPRRRPERLAARHARIANRIAWCWSDTALSAQMLEDLLTDRRGGRSGFAPAILHELRRLQRYNAERAKPGAPQGGRQGV